jgi:O2-independent ubiquinone biosynthesis protein UbiV
MRLSLGPIPYYWPRETVHAFYRAMASAPVDVVYLGETVCSRRHELRLTDWLELAGMLEEAGKEIVLSTQSLIESESDLKTLRRLVSNGRYAIEANEMGAVSLAAGSTRFVAGASLNIYNPETLGLIAALGAHRWIAPLEMSRTTLAQLHAARPPGVETEVYAYGRVALAHSARCFTARRFNLQKDDCRFRCIDFPEGLPAHTREGQPLFVLNGVQTMSAEPCNLIREVPVMAELGIALVRVGPGYANMLRVLELFREAMDNPDRAEAAARELERVTGDACDGFWQGAPGMQRMRRQALV